MHDRRLLGTWRSDRNRTGREIAARRDISRSQGRRLRQLFGALELRFTRTRCYTSFKGEVKANAYRVVAKDSASVIVAYLDPESGEETLYQLHFEGRHYWMCLGAIREYFRKTA